MPSARSGVGHTAAIGLALATVALAAGCAGTAANSRESAPGAARETARAAAPAARRPPPARIRAATRGAPAGRVRAAPPACVAGRTRPLGSARVAVAAVALRPTRAFRAPGRRPFASFGLTNENGARTVFGAVGVVVDRRCRATWYRVQLPVRPNGATGFVPAGAVAVERLRTRILVDLSQRRLWLYRAGRVVLAAPVAVGRPETPTPTGRYYVDQRLIPADPTGPFGPGAIGISAHSDVLRDWAQGGPIAIHGTNEPWSIGRAASHGCIRVANTVLERLFAATPAGTPVLIRA